MNYLHTMVRISNIEESLRFYCTGLGMIETRRYDNEKGKFTLIFLCAPNDKENAIKSKSPLLELTYNWSPETYTGGRNFGHLAFEVEDIYKTCEHLQSMNIDILRPPKDGRMAFIKSPDGISIELLQKNSPLTIIEPWKSMPNKGTW